MIENDSQNEEAFPSPKEELSNNLLYINLNQEATVKKPSLCLNIIYFIFPCLQKVDTTTRRKVYFRQTEQNITTWSNREENHKYSVLLFIPIVLFNQFKQFGNFFYLLLTISQIFPILKVGFLFTNLAPLCIVVCFSMLKELYDDIKRRIQDKKTNSTLVTTLSLYSDKSMNIVPKKSEEINIGDILELNKDSRVPADIIVLKTFNDSEENQAFIRTDQLDGETDWKLRKAPGVSQEMKESDIVNIDGYIEYEPPSKLIYNFNGVLYYRDNQGKMQKEPLNLENTMWASTVVASKKVIGIVVYTGKETRAKMNSSTPKYKMGVLDHELNFLNVYLAVIMVSLSLIITSLKGFNIVIFVKFIIIFSSIVPIALKVNLDVSKTWFSYIISKDDNIPETLARNSNIPEELGRISYIFSDKTGTLTKNEMVFKNIAMESEIFGEENFEDLKNILSDECKQYDSPLMDLINVSAKTDLSSSNSSNNLIDTSSQSSIKPKKRRRERSKLIRDCITSMVLCNNVTPTDNGYQASSPDEIALVQFAETLKMVLTHRTDKNIQLKDAADNVEDFDILANFPFSSDTKRMGIILRNKKYKHIIFYLKGAENVMTKFVKKEYIGFIKENAENLAVKGLRTLVLTQRILSEEEFQKWEKEYEEASASMENRKENMAKVVSKLENNMDFLCVTGVEDLLQDEVYSTIDNLRSAGMKIWMLTGDKVETATCISISAGIKNKKQKIFTIKYDDLLDYNNMDNIDDSNIKQNNELKTRFSINNDNEEENNIINNNTNSKDKNNKKLKEEKELNCRINKLRKFQNINRSSSIYYRWGFFRLSLKKFRKRIFHHCNASPKCCMLSLFPHSKKNNCKNYQEIHKGENCCGRGWG